MAFLRFFFLVLLGKEIKCFILQMFKNNWEMKWIWITLKSLGHLPFCFSRLLSFLLPLLAVLHICLEVELWISFFAWFQSPQLHKNEHFDISQRFAHFILQFIVHQPWYYPWSLWKITEENRWFQDMEDPPLFQYSMPAPVCNAGIVQSAQREETSLSNHIRSKTPVFTYSSCSLSTL